MRKRQKITGSAVAAAGSVALEVEEVEEPEWGVGPERICAKLREGFGKSRQGFLLSLSAAWGLGPPYKSGNPFEAGGCSDRSASSTRNGARPVRRVVDVDR